MFWPDSDVIFMTFCSNYCYHRVHTDWQLPLSGVHSYIPSWWKNSPAWWGMGEGGGRTPLIISTITLWCTLQLKGQIHSLCFYSAPICTLRLLLLLAYILGRGGGGCESQREKFFNKDFFHSTLPSLGTENVAFTFLIFSLDLGQD